MIKTQNKIFYICGKNYTYAMYVNDMGFLQHAYYGKKINHNDLLLYINEVCKKLEPLKEDLNLDFSLDSMPSEFGCFFNHGDYHEPSVIIEQLDGATMCRYRYFSHEVKDEVIDIAELPHARGCGQTLSITLKDDFSDMEIVLNYTVFDDCDVIVRNAEIKNVGHTAIVIKKAFSFCLDLPKAEYKLLRLHGRWAGERIPEITPIGHAVTKLQSILGQSSHQMNPFAAILKDDCGEDVGECYGAQLIYSGNFAITAEIDYNDRLRIQGGINECHFEWELDPQVNFVTPQVALCYSATDIGQLSREYADFIRGHIVNSQYVYKKRPIVVNNWEATYFDFDNERLFSIIDEAAKLGIDTFVLDDGWFGKRNSDATSLGDWFVNNEKLNGGLKALTDRCKNNGLNFGIWFEPEAISEYSDLYRVHPDWAIGKEGVEPARWRNQLVLDFTRKDIVDYIFNAVSKILKDNEISYVKWDFNRNISEFYSRRLTNQGGFAHRYILGVYYLAEKLTKEFPDVFFEGCAGGGGRFDTGMLYYFPQIWTSDNTDAIERMKIQWGTSMCYPLSSMSCHVSACPNHQTGRVTPIELRGTIASLGATGYELDLTKLSDLEKLSVKQQIANYKKIDELILKGDLFRLSDPFYGDFCEMIVSKDKRKAYFVYATRNERSKNVIRLKGLDASKLYTVNDNMTFSGHALMCVGLPLPVMDKNMCLSLTICEKISKSTDGARYEF